MVLNGPSAWLQLLKTHWAFISCLASVINVKSKNWSPPANNGSCLGHDLFIIYTLLKMFSYLLWGVPIPSLRYLRAPQTLVSLVKCGSDISPCNSPGTKAHGLKTKEPIHSEWQISLTRFQGFRYYIGYSRFKAELQLLVENSILQLQSCVSVQTTQKTTND